MKPTVLTFLTYLSGNSGRRRKLLSALVSGLLFMVGVPAVTQAAGPDHAFRFDNVTITVTRDHAVAGVGQDSILVNISPAPAPGEKITFNWAGFGIDADVDAAGNARFGVGATAAGQLIVSIYRGTTFLQDVTLTFIAAPGPVDPTKSYLEVIQSPQPADGASEDIVRAHLFDQYGNVITQATPTTFDIQSGTASFTSPNAPTPGSGSAGGGTIDARLTSNVVGDVVVHATAGGVPITNVVTVQFIAGPVDPTKSYLDIQQNPAAADGVAEDIVRAHLFDKYGHLVDTLVNFVIVSGTASFSSPSSGKSAGGIRDANLVSNVVGYVNVTATVKINGVDVPISGSPVTVQFIVDPPDVTNPETKLVVDVPVAPNDGVTTAVVHAHLVDDQGRLIDYPLDKVTFFIVPGGTANATAVLAGGGNNITPNGTGDIPLTITNAAVGTVTIGATVTYKGKTYTITFGSPATVTFVDKDTPDPSNPGNMLVVDKNSATADGVDYTIIHAHLVNGAGGALPAGVTVNVVFFIIPSGGPEATAVLVPQSTVTVGNGDIYLRIYDTKVGTIQLGARITVGGSTTAITTGSPAIVNFVSGPAVPSAPGAPGGLGTKLTIVKNFAPADGVSTNEVNAYITDATGNPKGGIPVTFSIRAGGTSTATAQLIGTVTVPTDPSGKATFGNAIMKIINTVAGTVWIDATIDYNGVPTLIDGSYQEVTFTNVADVTNPATRLIVVVYEALADGQSTTMVKAHIVDQNGDPLPGQNVTFTIDSGTAQIITPGPWTTDANGDVSIELTSSKPGFVLVTATVTVGAVEKAIINGSPARVKFAAINIYVPKVFTPNGDGMNDVLKPILVGISTFHYFSVYNRWGNLIFTTQDPNYGWDGRFKGVPQPVETYLWIAEGIDINGKKIVAKGMTSLVK